MTLWGDKMGYEKKVNYFIPGLTRTLEGGKQDKKLNLGSLRKAIKWKNH